MRQDQKKAERRFSPTEFWFLLIGSIFAGLLLVEFVFEIFFTLHGSARIFLVGVISICYYSSSYLYAARTGDKRFLRAVQWFLLIVYLACLIDITLLSKSLGRDNYFKDRDEYVYWHVNLVPLYTIKQYIVGYRKGYFNLWWVFANLPGNLCLLMPFSLFLPLLIRHQRRWYFFLPTILTISAAIEALQYLLMSGSCDIDDIILNFIGATAVFFLLKIPPLRRFLRKITLTEF